MTPKCAAGSGGNWHTTCARPTGGLRCRYVCGCACVHEYLGVRIEVWDSVGSKEAYRCLRKRGHAVMPGHTRALRFTWRMRISGTQSATHIDGCTYACMYACMYAPAVCQGQANVCAGGGGVGVRVFGGCLKQIEDYLLLRTQLGVCGDARHERACR